jgi:pyruvate dehydrogenase E1 component beta subunit
MEKMQKPLRETIKEIVREHLTSGHIAMGQCLTAVGWVGGTLPELYEKDGMIELSMADVAGGGFAVGAALAGKRPIYIIRYQGFCWFNLPIILNYACKSKEIWNRPSPLLVRSIAMEGAIGPVAGSCHHSLAYRMPGISILAPMTSREYETAYKMFMDSDDVFLFSEHRGSFGFSGDLDDNLVEEPDLVIVALSITRFQAEEAAKILVENNKKVSFVNLWKLKPLEINKNSENNIRSSKYGFIVIDDDYEEGIGGTIGQKIAHNTNQRFSVLGLESRSAGFSKTTDNLPPTKEKIIEIVLSIIKE